MSASQFEIPLSRPEITPEDREAVDGVLKSGVLSIGPRVEEFEEAFARQMGVPHAVAVSSGTAALHLAILLAEIDEDDEVIVSPFSFIASANAPLFEKGTPVFVDIEEDRLGIDPTKIENAITNKTKAILPTHVFGRSAEIGKIASLAKEYDLILIEDNCESPGSTIHTAHNEQLAGGFGQFAAYGFYPNKLITTGEGGILTAQSKSMADMARSLRNQGRGSVNGIHMEHDALGFNYRMSEIQAALGISQLKRLKESIRKRNELVNAYIGLLQDDDRIKLPYTLKNEVHTWFVFSIRVRATVRDKVIGYLAENGIQAKAYFYPPIHLQPYYQQKFGLKTGAFPIAERISNEIIALPLFNQMTIDQVNKVVLVLKKGLDKS